MEIGKKIKRLRLQRGLTQEELALRCELTKGYISQLENDVSSPSIATLDDLLNILGISFTEFFSDGGNEKIVFTKSDFFESEAGGGIATWLIPNSQKNQMEPIILTVDSGCESELRAPFDGQEFGYILDGKIEIEIFGEKSRKIKAKKGDAFYIDGKKEHKLVSTGKTCARILWVATPSNF